MIFLRALWWKLFGSRQLSQKLDRLTLPQLNLLEARIYEAGCMSPSIESLFEHLREEKAR